MLLSLLPAAMLGGGSPGPGLPLVCADRFKK
jgi:hypothetical protein